MEKYKLSRFLPHNEILDHIMALDEDQDGVSSFFFHNAEDYGIYLVTLLDEIAKKKILLFVMLNWVNYAWLIYIT